MLAFRNARLAWGVLYSGGCQIIGGVQAASALDSCTREWGTTLGGLEQWKLSSTQVAMKVQDDHLQLMVDNLHDQLSQIGIPRNVIERIVRKRLGVSGHVATVQQLQERIEALWNVTKADTPRQQQLMMKKLYHSPELLHFPPDNLWHRAHELSRTLEQQGLSALTVQTLISKQPAVLTFKPQHLAQKLQEMSEQLCISVEEVCYLCIKQRTLINISIAVFVNKLRQLAQMLQIEPADVALIVQRFPAVIASDMDTVKSRFEAVQECLHDWPTAKLGQALVVYPAVLTCKPDTIRHKWAVVNAYAAVHHDSRLQIDAQRSKTPIMNVFCRPASRYQLLQYLLQQQQQSQGLSSSGSSSSENLHRRRKGGRNSKGSMADITALEPDVTRLPLVLGILNTDKKYFELLVDSNYPEFWGWQQQQQQQIDEVCKLVPFAVGAAAA